ncbi:MAG: hypothetical protein KKD59_01230 [Acidobacteria bacterium]|nr:hypothetical protein [Acidobacteriota bacterium]
MKLRVKRIHKEARLPSYGHPGDAGMDLYAVEDVVLERGNPVPVPTGIQVAIPVGHVGLVWDKSGVSLSGVHRLAGVIDAGYRGEIRVVLINLDRKNGLNEHLGYLFSPLHGVRFFRQIDENHPDFPPVSGIDHAGQPVNAAQ